MAEQAKPGLVTVCFFEEGNKFLCKMKRVLNDLGHTVLLDDVKLKSLMVLMVSIFST